MKPYINYNPVDMLSLVMVDINYGHYLLILMK